MPTKLRRFERLRSLTMGSLETVAKYCESHLCLHSATTLDWRVQRNQLSVPFCVNESSIAKHIGVFRQSERMAGIVQLRCFAIYNSMPVNLEMFLAKNSNDNMFRCWQAFRFLCERQPTSSIRVEWVAISSYVRCPHMSCPVRQKMLYFVIRSIVRRR